MKTLDEFVFDVMIMSTLERLKENNTTAEIPTLPVITCRTEHLKDLCDYLQMPKNKKLFEDAGFIPIIQITETEYEEELMGGFIGLLVLTSLIVKELSIPQHLLKSLRLEAREIAQAHTQQQVLRFVDHHLGFLLEDIKDFLDRN